MAENTGQIIGDEETNSAKRRRQHAYAQDLEVQIEDKNAAKLREKFQGMNVNASGYLDPEKGPERFKPLGNSGIHTERSGRTSRVVPYHARFVYERGNERSNERSRTPPVSNGKPQQRRRDHLNLDSTAHLTIHPLTHVSGNQQGMMGSVDHAYMALASINIDRSGPGGYGSIVQPLVVPYVDNRPIIMPNNVQQNNEYHPKFNPFLVHNDSNDRELRALLAVSQLETQRQKTQLAKEQDENQRRLRKELEGEKRKIEDQEIQARRRLELLRNDLEDQRRDLAQQRLKVEVAKTPKHEVPSTAPLTIRPSSDSLFIAMDDTRKSLIIERQKIEELLKARKKQPDYRQVKLLKRRLPPPTPPRTDRANIRVIREFAELKNKEAATRQVFRKNYPTLPDTNLLLEQQQKALIVQQEANMANRTRAPKFVIRKYMRPEWMDRPPTPLPHRLKQKDRLYPSTSSDNEIDILYWRAHQRERALDTWGLSGSTDPDKVIDHYESLRLRSKRPMSTETLTDDTWLRPSSVAVV